MFFIMGINDGRKDLDFDQMSICGICGKYGHYRVFMTYMVLSLFFIPTFKWAKHYYVQSSCCNTLYELNPEVGKAIARGEKAEITPGDLTRVQSGGWNSGGYKKCDRCGYETQEDFEYCPKCGNKLN
ncbi:MAG: zinc ribbon domain-containing protein [Lachnospiraceae bacterium]|nr:zinc ribbon domain-containing protein [Lachnospiraceae bacterium]